MVSKKISTVILLLLLIGCSTGQTTLEAVAPADIQNAADPELISEETGNVKTFYVTGENFKFMMDGQEAPELKVNVGDRVRIKFTNNDGYHDLVIDEFNARTEKIRAPESRIVEFVADKAGTFEYYCSIGSHRAQGMKGTLVVT